MIKLRGYEYKYQHQNDLPGVISGGVMWESNELLHFQSIEGGTTCDLLNSPFEYEDLMVGSPYKISGQTIYEEDIIEFIDSGTIAIVKQDVSLGWVMVANNGTKFILFDSIHQNLKLIGNTYLEKDEFIADNNSTFIGDKDIYLVIEELIETIEKDDKLVKINLIPLSNNRYDLDFVFETTRRATNWAKWILNDEDELYLSIRNIFGSISTNKNILILN